MTCVFLLSVGGGSMGLMRFGRHRVLDPYRCAFDPRHVRSGKSGAPEAPPHKYLFHCYVYEFHSLQMGVLIKGLVSVCI